jgi:hypothetical protein
MQVAFIQHSTIDPEKSTVIFEARTETRAKDFSSPGGTITLPDCELPLGLDGAKRAATSASCNPPESLPTVCPAACELTVVNCSVPGRLFPAQVPPVTKTASGRAGAGIRNIAALTRLLRLDKWSAKSFSCQRCSSLRWDSGSMQSQWHT